VNEFENCGLTDLAILQTEPAQQCSPNSFGILPFNPTCPYSGEGERTYHQAIGQFRYYLEKYGEDALHGVFIVPSDPPAPIPAIMPDFRASQQVGIGLDYETGMSALAEQSAYTPVIQEIKDHQSTYARTGLDYKGTVLLRKEAEVQGVDSVLVWDCS